APTNFKGSFVVEVTASDGSLTAKQSFTVSVPNVAPTLAPIANQSVAAGRSLTVPLSVGDVNGDAITLSARAIAPSSLAYSLKTQLGLTYAGSCMTGLLGAGEKWLSSTSGRWYLLFPNGQLRKWAGTLYLSLQSTALIATLPTGYYTDPSL